LFCSYNFLAFFVVVFLAYWGLPWRRARVGLLLAASFVFYASWNHWLALLVFASSTADYLLALAIDALSSRRRRRWLVAASVLMNLGLLGYFKYANFFLRSLEEALTAAGAAASLPVLRVLAPIGISFYTFEAINYVVDVYRRRLPAERSLAHFLLFITFFPHLVAGPIVRARDFLPQVRRPKRWSWGRFHLGGGYVLLGMFKKLVVADHMALIADPVFADPARYATGTLWLAALAYTLQIYCDFSGYSDLALGTAHMLGYKLAPNFNMPYLAANFSDFWRRWHISLSGWMRDYVYVPLGGNRGSRWRTGCNLMATMVVSGLWHGANWTFVVWGFFHGVLLLAQRGLQAVCRGRPGLDALLRTRPGTLGRIAVTFVGVLCGFVIFRSTTLPLAATMLGRMFVPQGGEAAPADPLPVWHAFAILAVGHWVAASGLWKRFREGAPAPIRGLGYAGLLVLVLVLAPLTTKTFIYFQF
jgi:alginate O-acetyltransferase complex protein AlgI